MVIHAHTFAARKPFIHRSTVRHLIPRADAAAASELFVILGEVSWFFDRVPGPQRETSWTRRSWAGPAFGRSV
jgi:hypothetical protein